MEYIFVGIQMLMNPETMLAIIAGTLTGIVFGALPGLTSTVAVALLIPISYGMDPIAGVALLLSAFVGGTSGGSIPAILLNIPGTPSSICTTMDGYPMAKKGNAGLALGTSLLCSILGGQFSFLALLLFTPILAELTLQFGPLENLGLVTIGLLFSVFIVQGSKIKGFLSLFLGLALSCIGLDTITGSSRWTFHSINLIGGLNLLPVVVGLLALPQIITEVLGYITTQTQKETKTIGYSRVTFPSLSKMLSEWKTILLSSVIGCFVGILPGIGGSVASMTSYMAAKKISKRPETFGQGNIEGIIAAETSNNAMCGGALIPVLTLAIPGESCTAVLLGGLMLHGIRLGPSLFHEHIDLLYGIIFAFFIANTVMFLVQSCGIRLFVKILKIPKEFLLPPILVLCVIGTYSISTNLFDVWMLLAFGTIGVLLKKYNYSAIALVMGFILGSMFEKNLRTAMILYTNVTDLFTRPIACVLFAVVIGIVVSMIFDNKKKVKNDDKRYD